MRRGRALAVLAAVMVALAGTGRVLAQETEAAAPAATATAGPAVANEFRYFSFMTDSAYGVGEKVALVVTLLIAVAGLVYAGMLVGQVLGAGQGTEKMRGVGRAIR